MAVYDVLTPEWQTILAEPASTDLTLIVTNLPVSDCDPIIVASEGLCLHLKASTLS